MENLNYSLWLLVYTLLIFGWVYKCKDKTLKLVCFFLMTFLYLYCGFGICYLHRPNVGYIWTYIIYTAVLSFSINMFRKKNVRMKQFTPSIFSFSNKWSTAIISFYFILLLLPLVQGGNIGNLISPPSPALGDVIAETNFEEAQVSSIGQSIITFVRIFFLFAIIKYINKPWVIALFMILPSYINYCNSAYFARSGTAYQVMVLLLVLYHYYPKARKYIVTSCFIAIPSVVIFFAAYVDIRLGNASSNLGFIDALGFLLESETYYPKWYDYILGDGRYAFNYIYWLITLPLPGFMKPFNINVNFNALFTAESLGISLNDIDSISLPGLVNESVFVFGKYLFFIHAIIFAFIFMLTYNTLKSDKRNYILMVTIMLQMSVLSFRGGTSTYALPMKTLFVLFVFYLLFNRRGQSVQG